ncbi:putative transcription factor MYB-HB-like family [Rosa chinensis]|uniref:Putative transcription factor MYB-HB-like family n=1 Tax=Rosa chinensis TaxID=74649 RepID=A0A2P6RH30_ROSCH|nr:putative transcription factor MYB-HB-like family [Rosa chinensis]
MSIKGANWTRKEDEALCIVFIQVSKNSDKGTSQKETDIWKQVEQKFKEFFNGTPPNVRNFESCKSRWQKHLFPQMNKLHQCVKCAERRIHCGANQSDQQHFAEDFYKDDMNGKNFRHQRCYN